jgi:response regulator RpfG family c-di-GMP phosphodiesterase
MTFVFNEHGDKWPAVTDACFMDKPRILLVDDDSYNRSTIKSILSLTKAEIFEIPPERDVLSVTEEGDFDLIIANLKRFPFEQSAFYHKFLPGQTVAQKLPLILVGSSESSTDIKKAMAAGATAYLDRAEARNKLIPLVQKLFSDSTEKAMGKKILVVDDSKTVRMMLKDGLIKEGYQIVTANNGKEALEVVQSVQPDLILSDVYMPEMSGIELCQSLHENVLYSDIPFVVMSTENDAGNMKKMMEYGAAAFIIKPFNLEQLMVTLNKIFSYEFLILLKEKERLDGEQKLLIAGITSLVKALEARDKYTRGHSDRVSLILSGLVKHSGGSKYDIERAHIAGQLHDIGKIGVRDNILLKPGRLNDEEFFQIKQHPSIGAAIIQTIPSISDIVPVVRSHHERMDGKGYPEGLTGKDIPLWARMTAVADTYDALTTDRPYRKGKHFHEALDVIKSVSGTQLCSDCVNLFLDWCGKEDTISDYEKKD